MIPGTSFASSALMASARHAALFSLVAITAAAEGRLHTPNVAHRLVRPVQASSRSSLLLAAAPLPPPDNAKGVAVAWGVCGFLGILAEPTHGKTVLQPFFRLSEATAAYYLLQSGVPPNRDHHGRAGGALRLHHVYRTGDQVFIPLQTAVSS